MPDDHTTAVEALLVQTARAHGVFEGSELGGVYDQAWPRWYATYAVEHGMGALVGGGITIDRLAEFLAGSNVEFEKTAPEPRAVGDLHRAEDRRGAVVGGSVRLDRDRRATRATTRFGRDDRVGRVAARSRRVDHLEHPARLRQMAFEPAKPGVEGLESGDPIRDVGAPLADESRSSAVESAQWPEWHQFAILPASASGTSSRRRSIKRRRCSTSGSP